MKQLGISKNGVGVVDRYKSHIDCNLKDLVRDALSRVDISSEVFQEHTIKFDKFIGFSNVIKVRNTDKIFYAKRIGRKGFSKFTDNKVTKKSKSLTIVLLKSSNNENEYILVTGYIGERIGPEPYDNNCKDNDRKQWKNIAFVSNLVDFNRETVTEIAPTYWQY